MSSITIAGTHSGCGKTTVTAGIMAALVSRGIKVQPFKVGPDYIDPMFHTYITGRISRNLDSWLLEEAVLTGLFLRNSGSASVSVIEGVMGLYDGFGGQSSADSTAHVAKIIKSPVVLVVDGEGMSLSIAALIKGFQDFDREVPLSGVIINNINSEAHYNLLKEIITFHLGIPVLGYLPRKAEYAFESRHLGLIPSEEIPGLKEKITRLAMQAEKTIDLDWLLQIARQAGTIHTAESIPEKKYPEPAVRIAVARDRAFNFYYEDNLDLLRQLGAEAVFFSPLEDLRLPERIGGLYLGGGYPEVWAAILQDNCHMRQSIKQNIIQGLPAYAECGGLMYLSESIADKNGRIFEMAGVIPGKAKMTGSLQRFGYVEIQITEDTVIAKKGAAIRGHEFHYSTTDVDAAVPRCYRVSKIKQGQETKVWRCGFKIRNMLAGYAHLHFWSNPAFAQEFIGQCTEYSKIFSEKVKYIG
jgi:cobyrinic acid a,c-diamide synthase